MRIRNKISLFVIPLATVPLILIGTLAYRFLNQGFREQAYLEDQQLCMIAVTRIEQVLNDCRNSLLWLSSQVSARYPASGQTGIEDVLQSENDPIQVAARDLALRHSPYVQIRFISPEGKEWFKTRGLPSAHEPGSALQESIFLQAIACVWDWRWPRPVQLPAVEQKRPGHWTTTFSMSLIDDMILRGLIFIDLDLQAFSKILDESARTRPAYYFLFDGTGTRLAAGGDSTAFNSDIFQKKYAAAFRRMRKNPKPSFAHTAFDVGGKRYFLSFHPVKEHIAMREPIPQERWYLGMVRSETPLLVAFRRTQNVFLIILALGLGIAILSTFYLARRITSPINQLTAATQKFARGQLDTRVELTSRDEIGGLASDFNRMAADLVRLLRERKANETLVAIGRFSSALAHDLKNPVEGLRLLSRELAKRVNRDQEAYELAQAIGQSVDNLAVLLDQSLDFSRLQQPQFADTDLQTLISEVTRGLNLQHVVLKQRLSPNMPMVHVDATQIKRVLANLLNNALEACRQRGLEGGGEVSLTVQPDGTNVRIEIADTGQGIAPEISGQIFNPFFTTKPGGHGLGLALARQIIANHGGTIAFETEIGRGTQFTIELPVGHKRL